MSKSTLAGRYLKAVGLAQGEPAVALGYVERSGWTDAAIIKAAISGASTGNTGALVGPGVALMDLVRERSIVGRMTGFREVPFLTRTARQTSDSQAAWIAENTPIPITRAVFSEQTGLAAKKLGAIAVQTAELAQASDSERILQDDLAQVLATKLDRSFTDPSNAGSTAEPASVTNGLTPITATSDPAADLRGAVSALATTGGDFTRAYWLTTAVLHAALILKGVVSENGLLAGRPILSSTKGVPTGVVALVDPGRIELAGGTEAHLSAGSHGMVRMTDDMTPPAAEDVTISLWQINAISYKGITPINWSAAPGAAAVVTGAAY